LLDIEKLTLAQCAALHALSNNGNQVPLSFQTAELFIIECENVRIFHTPSTFGAGNEDDRFFYSV
jgi:hypothetical protein